MTLRARPLTGPSINETSTAPRDSFRASIDRTEQPNTDGSYPTVMAFRSAKGASM